MRKNEKGFTGIEIAIAIVLIFIFVSIIATLIYNLKSETKALELEAEASNIAVETMEEIKSKEFTEIIELEESQANSAEEIKAEPVFGKEGYYKKVELVDYVRGKNDASLKSGIVIKATVTVEYQFKGKKQEVKLETVLSNSEGV